MPLNLWQFSVSLLCEQKIFLHSLSKVIPVSVPILVAQQSPSMHCFKLCEELSEICLPHVFSDPLQV